jgi:hypothetical protein
MNNSTPDAAAMRLMRKQHAFARVEQLYEIGLTKYQIANRVRKGIYVRVAYGVVGLAGVDPAIAARAMRGVLIAGKGAVAARWTAAELHELQTPRDERMHVLISGCRQRSSVPDLCLHRTRHLPARHITEVDAVPTTSLARTIVDCAASLDRWSALHMLDSCSASPTVWRTIHLTAEELSNGRAGVRAIADATAPDGADRMRSMLERITRETLRARGVPDGEWNVTIFDARGPIREVDLCYRVARVIVELDGLRFHRGPSALQRDRATDRRLQIERWRILRFTWNDVVHRPTPMVDEIMLALDAA